jgi:hypothetical protein
VKSFSAERAEHVVNGMYASSGTACIHLGNRLEIKTKEEFANDKSQIKAILVEKLWPK